MRRFSRALHHRTSDSRTDTARRSRYTHIHTHARTHARIPCIGNGYTTDISTIFHAAAANRPIRSYYSPFRDHPRRKDSPRALHARNRPRRQVATRLAKKSKFRTCASRRAVRTVTNTTRKSALLPRVPHVPRAPLHISPSTSTAHLASLSCGDTWRRAICFVRRAHVCAKLCQTLADKIKGDRGWPATTLACRATPKDAPRRRRTRRNANMYTGGYLRSISTQ